MWDPEQETNSAIVPGYCASCSDPMVLRVADAVRGMSESQNRPRRFEANIFQAFLYGDIYIYIY